ncbi:MAG: hypothetical protein AB8B69_20615 [Chitinophagales bacterium]
MSCVAAVFLLLTVAGTPPIKTSYDSTCLGRYPSTETLGTAFKHLIPGKLFGTCWSCPLHFKRTASAIEAWDACFGHVKAEKTGVYGCSKKYKNSFHDPRKGGECWTCPAGFRRTWDPVTAKRACSKGILGPFSKASYKGKPGCNKGFKDPVDGGTCWFCPREGKRTIYHVKGDKACEVRAYATKRD